MALTDTLFLFLFLPVALLVCLLGPRLQKYFLLVLSLAFYAFGSPKFFLLFVFLLALNIALAYGIRFLNTNTSADRPAAGKVLLIIGAVLNVSTLFYYKYFDFTFSGLAKLFGTSFTARNLILPLGISFFSFKAISLLADVYRKDVELPKNPVFPALYLAFFGQVISGPITDYNEFYKYYKPKRLERSMAFKRLQHGSVLFIRGYIKKILLADMLGKVAMETFSGSQTPSAAYLWLGAICYSLELYYDFSGYSDMAIGLGRFFGIHSEMNFKYPYTTTSVSEFWRLWHVSLGRWFRKYVYFPLGGSRVEKQSRLIFNLFAVWILTGIWHGANLTFILWGMFYFAWIVMEKVLNLPGRLKFGWLKALYRIPVLLFINFQWVMFNSKGVKEGFQYIGGMFVARDRLADIRAGVLWQQYSPFIILAVIFAMPVFPLIEKNIRRLPGKAKIAAEVVLAGVLSVLFVISVSFVIAGNNNPFLYGNF